MYQLVLFLSSPLGFRKTLINKIVLTWEVESRLLILLLYKREHVIYIFFIYMGKVFRNWKSHSIQLLHIDQFSPSKFWLDIEHWIYYWSSGHIYHYINNNMVGNIKIFFRRNQQQNIFHYFSLIFTYDNIYPIYFIENNDDIFFGFLTTKYLTSGQKWREGKQGYLIYLI